MQNNYQTFNKQHGFAEKAGFNLTALQQLDANSFVQWQSSLNRYEVGGGKTAVSTVVSLMRPDVSLTIVVCPPILIEPWCNWLRKVSERVLAYKGDPRERKQLHSLIASSRWVVLSNAIFRSDFQVLLAETKHSQDRLEVIVDEAQNLKNPESVLYKYVSLISANNYLQLLSGTPTSTPADAYAYIKLKTPQTYRSWGHFEMIHVEEKDIFKRVTKWQNLDILAERFGEQSIARTKEELHGYNIKPLYPDTSYELSKPHQRLYEKLVDEQLLLLDNGTKIDATTSQKLYQAVQQIVVNFDYFSGDPSNRSAAYDLIDQTIESTDCLTKGRSKLIIWTNYKRTSHAVWKYLERKGIDVMPAYGDVDSNKSFKRFMDVESCRILVAQPTSAGVGLNPQALCWESLAVEFTTVPMHMIQANGRLDRVGQKHIPTIRLGVALGTIQVGLLDQLLGKADLVAKVEGSKTKLRDILLGR